MESCANSRSAWRWPRAPTSSSLMNQRRVCPRLTELLLNLSDTVATVLVEHDMDVALAVADRVIVLESGSMIAKGSPSQIESDPLVRAVYLGEQHRARSERSSGPRADLDR